MLPIKWLKYFEVLDVNMEIAQNLYNVYCMLKYIFVGNDFDSQDPKIRGPCIHLQFFYVAALIEECGTNNHYTLAIFRNSMQKRQDHII